MLLPVSLTLGIVLAAAVAAWAWLGRSCEILVAGGRAAVQLAAVSLIIGWMARSLAPLEIVRPAASDALLPGLDQTGTVGLVALPGAFVGMLLGGASSVEAGVVQLFVPVALMAVQVVAVATVLELVARGRLHRG
ncbi:ABC transporter permease [Streptomyces sp. NPDC006267]|uniref:ABC transporter permease n=1 Tax=unclassified Streptomyces TaxID=2593676 RepID=UPI0033ADA8E9